MKLAHRIRMLVLLRRADSLLRKAKQQRDYLNRPHQQSAHLIGHPVPHPEPEYRLRTVYAVATAALFALVAYLNLFYTEPASVMACTQIASK